MSTAYYERELANLRTLAAEFAARNPALAPLLGAGVAPDPDVERLLEGVAFLTGLARQRLDDEFPEFIQALAQLLFPQYLQPLPSMSIVQFTPKARAGLGAGAASTIAAGVEVASLPIDGVRTIFRSAFPVTVEPVTLCGARWEGAGPGGRTLLLEFEFDGVAANAWAATRLRLYLGDALSEAARLLLLLMRQTREIQVGGPDGALALLPPEALEMAALGADLPLLPYPDNAHPAYCLLREYFAYPEKFLFVDLTGIDRWRERGNSARFSVRFVFDEVPDWAPAISVSSFMLNATPVVNLFETQAHPIAVDHRHAEYRVQLGPQGGHPAAQIFALTDVRGYLPSGEIVYSALGAFTNEDDVYNVRIRPSALDDGHEHFIGLPYIGAARERAGHETLSVRVSATNGRLADGVRLGDISQPADSSPPRMNFSNVRAVSRFRPAVIDDALLWHVLAHLGANHLRLAERGQLCSLLALQLPHGRATAHDQAMANRIASIEQFSAEPGRRFVDGVPVDGTEIELVCNGERFLNLGGLFLFGSILDEFFAGTTSLNTFTALRLRDSVSGEELQWPAKIGRQRLL